ncbi:MAG TPA: hypothetical protein VHZ74_12700 [Bryobacteraceae bacterium]|nr:hypothetical protein [Bryobacteraceae bacterium]
MNCTIRWGRHSACRRYLFVVLSSMLPAGCGYVGEPLPPALRRPVRVVDLAAVEHGSKIVIRFTIPKVTTENLPIKGKPDVDLRIGPAPDPFQLAEWQRTAERVTVDQKGTPAQAEVDAAKFVGKDVYIAVDVRGPHGRSAGPSNFVRLPVVRPLPMPEAVAAKDAPDAVALAWKATAPEFRIFRKLQGAPELTQLGTSTMPSYLDKTIEYGKTYSYYVQSIQKTGDTYAESEVSSIDTFTPVDKFPPAVPVGLSPVPGTQSIELVWQPNSEKDFASYRVYRDGQRIGDNVTAPVFSDRNVKQGVKYAYQISAVDTTGNESAKSAAAESALP